MSALPSSVNNHPSLKGSNDPSGLGGEAAKATAVRRLDPKGLFLYSPFVVFLILLYLALGLFSEYWLGVVTTHPLGDDFKIYYGALLKAGAGENPYQPYSIGGSFIYHPFALTFVSLFSWVGDQWMATYLWMAASLSAWAIAIWLRSEERSVGKECRL